MLLITGATGFVGTHVIREINKHRKDIRILTSHPKKAKKRFPGFEIFPGDITRPDTLNGVGKNVDVIVHLAGMVSYTKPKDTLFRYNVEGTKNILNACRETEKILFPSSVGVYGEIKGKANEDYPLRPKTHYGESKIEAENIIRNSGIPSVIFRIAPIYGEGSPYWLKNLRLLEKGFPIPRTENLTHVVHVSNVAQAFRLGMRARGGTYNIADEKPVEFVKFAGDLVKALGNEPRLWPYWLVSSLAIMKGMRSYFTTLTMNRNYDVTRATEELGYDPGVNFRNELERMVEWYRSQSRSRI